MASIETSAPDVESAIAQGLAKLGLIRAETKIEVLDEGSKGVLGLGAKPAKVRLTPFAEIEPVSAISSDITEPASASATALTPESISEEEDPVAVDDADTDDVIAAEVDDYTPEDDANLAASITQDILDRMGFGTGTCVGNYIEPGDEQDHPTLWVDIDFEPTDEGDDDADDLMAHGQEGLNALQNLVQTMWSHQTKRSIRVTCDVNGFKQRRRDQLAEMAERMATQVIETGQSLTLDPMPAAERRMVHMTLRNHPEVVTESTGEGSSRKITIKLKE